MITKISQQNERAAFLKEIDQKNAKKELLLALQPLRHISWVSDFTKNLKHPQLAMPHQENANTEKFILGISIALCLFMQNKQNILENGLKLKQYIDKYAVHVPLSHTPIVIRELNQLIHQTSQVTQKIR